jgi:peptide/nickel transport system permease protein
MKKRKQSSDLFFNALFTTFIVLIIVFSTLRLIPGDPEESILGENASPIQRELLREQLGLNQPIHTQLKQYFFNLARFDLGTSISKKTKVSTLIKERLPNTVILAVIAILIASIFGIPLGAFHSWHPNHWISKVSSFLSILFLSMPSFWIGPLFVILFSLHYPWLPFSGFKSWDSIVLPAFTLGIGMGSVIYRITSAAIKDCLQKDYLGYRDFPHSLLIHDYHLLK